jgi:GH15 family glucan-1,4-alpha-glucosidase
MYVPISDYGLIGDCHSAALISRRGSIDWACLPRFDSPAVFLKILDDQRGGCCSIEAKDFQFSSRRYLEGTNILETTFHTATGVFTVTDFMPIAHRADHGPHGRDVENEERIVRIFRCSAGEVSFGVRVHPTFDFARARPATVRREGEAITLSAGNDALHVHLLGKFTVSEDPGAIAAELHLAGDEQAALAIGYAEAYEQPDTVTSSHVEQWLNETKKYWGKWSSSLVYKGDYAELVARSALTLKLLIYEPTGAIVAAPTTSLPEWIGGTRNWDYRYSWLRDSSFTLIALMELGYFGEACDFMRFLLRTLSQSEKRKVLYSVDGGTEQTEYELQHLDGYWGSRPVRIGNGAADQRQYDVAGELMQCISLYWRHEGFEHEGESFEREFWPLIKRIADRIAKIWREPDNGIWEVRQPGGGDGWDHSGGRRQFVHSKGLCWVTLDRALRAVKRFQIAGDFSHWERERDAIHASLEADGFNTQIGSYVQFYSGTTLDAALLRLPILNCLDPMSPRMQSTIAHIESRLTQNGLVCRYNPEVDGIGDPEGAFLACGFWLVENYVLVGRIEDAEKLFQRLCSCANDLGLLSEEADTSTGQLLGNFPQAFSHVGLINAAVRLSATKRGEKTSTEELMLAR